MYLMYLLLYMQHLNNVVLTLVNESSNISLMDRPQSTSQQYFILSWFLAGLCPLSTFVYSLHKWMSEPLSEQIYSIINKCIQAFAYINASKTMEMIIYFITLPSVRIYGQEIEVVEKYKYFGTIWTTKYRCHLCKYSSVHVFILDTQGI